MMKHLRSSLLLTGILFFGAMSMIGCKTAVEVLDVTGPDSLETNETGTFGAVVNEDASDPVSYTWNFGDNRTGIGSTATHSFSTPGTYTVTVTAENKKGPDSADKTIVVFRPPVPAQIVTISANPTTADTRTAVSFSANVRGDVPVSHSWDFGGMGSSSSQNPSHTFDTPGTYTVTLNVSNDAGSDSRTVSVQVNMYEADYCAEVIEMNSVFFARNSSQLSDEAMAALDENLQILIDCPNTNVRVEGFSAPGERNTQDLSDDRARAIEQYYTGNGTAASRVMAMGMGRVTGVTSKKDGAEGHRRGDTIPIR